MSTSDSKPAGPNLSAGIPAESLSDGHMIVGRVGGAAVLVARRGTELFAISAICTHYNGPLGEGLMVDDTVRCPWHHACFSLRTGEALRAPALSPVACWSVQESDGRIVVGQRRPAASGKRGARRAAGATPSEIVIVGGGAAGFAAANRLRREQYSGRIVMLSSDDASPVDRPNLSKDYLAGNAPEDWVPLRPDSYYRETGIELRTKATAVRIDPRAREVEVADGSRHRYDRLLLATGAEPVRLSIPGADQPHVHALRSLADSRAIIAQTMKARRAVVMGASFIGLEVAASLTARKIEVHVVAPDKVPMARVLGAELGGFVRALHEEHGVVFHLGDTGVAIDGKQVRLKSGGVIEADLVVAGIGVRPRIALAEAAGLTLDRGIAVDARLETSASGIFAAGDISRWPDPHTGDNIRVEHWVVAERQGDTAALNMLGYGEPFTAGPFFWSQHYDVPINYVGHAEAWDELAIDGNIAARDCVLRYRRNGRVLAVASIFRDLESLRAELKMERGASA